MQTAFLVFIRRRQFSSFFRAFQQSRRKKSNVHKKVRKKEECLCVIWLVRIINMHAQAHIHRHSIVHKTQIKCHLGEKKIRGEKKYLCLIVPAQVPVFQLQHFFFSLSRFHSGYLAPCQCEFHTCWAQTKLFPSIFVHIFSGLFASNESKAGRTVIRAQWTEALSFLSHCRRKGEWCTYVAKTLLTSAFLMICLLSIVRIRLTHIPESVHLACIECYLLWLLLILRYDNYLYTLCHPSQVIHTHIP